MGEKRQLVIGIEAFALREALLDVAFGFGDDAVLLARRAQVVPDVGGIDLGVRPFVPSHFQSVEPLPGGPHMVADDGDEIIEHDDLPHARHFFRDAVVDMLHLAAEHRALGKRRELHVRHHGVDAVDGLAVGFVRRVVTFQRLADQREILRILELRLLRHRQLGGGIGKLAVSERAIARGMGDVTI